MLPMKILINILDAITELSGRLISWATLLLMLLTLLVVILRYGFNIGSTAIQDTALYLHGAVFTFAAGYTLKHEGHVRVDVFYQTFSEKTRHLVDFFGTLLLLIPTSLFIGWVCLHYVGTSWEIKEASVEAGGLAYVYLQKTLLLVIVASLLIQGIVELYRHGHQLLTLRNS